MLSAHFIRSLVVGAEIYKAPSINPAIHRKNQADGRMVKVTSIGKKYFYTNDNNRWHMGNGMIDTQFSVGVELFESKQGYEIIIDRNRMWEALIKGMDKNKRDGCSIRTIVEAARVLNIDVGYKK